MIPRYQGEVFQAPSPSAKPARMSEDGGRVAGNRLAEYQPVRFGPKQTREFRAAIFDR